MILVYDTFGALKGVLDFGIVHIANHMVIKRIRRARGKEFIYERILILENDDFGNKCLHCNKNLLKKLRKTTYFKSVKYNEA